MRVLYDISSVGLGRLYDQSRGGAYRADLHTVEGLAASPECELRLCANHSAVAHRGCERFLRDHARLSHVPLVGASAGGGTLVGAAASVAHRAVRRLFRTNVLPSYLRRMGRLADRTLHPKVDYAALAEIDIVHTSPLAPLPPSGGRARPRRVLTLYDLAFIRFPEIYGPAYRDALRRAIDSLEASDHVVTTSAFVRDELVGAGVRPPARIHVVPLAADPALFHECREPMRLLAVRRKYAIPDGPYVLGVNTPDVRKNVPHAVDAFAGVVARSPDALGSLVLAGLSGSESPGLAQAIHAHPGLAGRIVRTGYVPDEDLAPLYSGAQVFVYNSIYEGFGLPPLEAMQCGTPVIASQSSSLPEVVGDGGILVAPEDVNELAGAILRAADAGVRAELRARALVQARRFSWPHSVACTLEAYRTALAE